MIKTRSQNKSGGVTMGPHLWHIDSFLHILVDGLADDVQAKGAAEGLLDHEPDLLDAEEPPHRERDDGHHPEAAGPDQARREREAPNAQEARRVPRVVERDRRLHESLTGANSLRKWTEVIAWSGARMDIFSHASLPSSFFLGARALSSAHARRK